MEADPKLLSELEKIQNPHKVLKLEIEIKGVFSYPKHWEEVDETSREFYTQKIEFQGFVIADGKTKDRELTKEEKAEEEEKQKKKQKKGKEEEVVLTPEQEAELKRKQEEEELKRIEEQRIWDSLSKEEQQYRTLENPQKHSAIYFKDNIRTIDLDAQGIKRIENDIGKAGKAEITFNRFIDVPEDELEGFKKKKPKGTTAEDMKNQLGLAKIDLTPFQTPGTTETIQRCHFT